MDVPVRLAHEPDRAHGAIEIGHRDAARENEIEVVRQVAAGGVKAGAGAAGEHGADVVLGQSAADGERYSLAASSSP